MGKRLPRMAIAGHLNPVTMATRLHQADTVSSQLSPIGTDARLGSRLPMAKHRRPVATVSPRSSRAGTDNHRSHPVTRVQGPHITARWYGSR